MACPFPVAAELFDHWNGKSSTIRHLLLQIAVGLGILEPTEPEVKGSTSPEEIKLMMANPKGFGGQVHGLDQLPGWMKASLAMLEASPKPTK